MIVVLRPMIAVTRLMSRALTRGEKTPVTSFEEIRLLAALGRAEGVLQKGLAGMIEGAVKLRELRARDVMVPRAGMMYLSGARSVDENLRLAKETGHSRFPFTHSGNPDQLDGIVLIKDLLFQLQTTPGEPHWDSLLGRFQVVPDSMPLERLLQTFREQRRHLALVVDEYGGTQGLVTLEDVLEEIVGEIEDESDRVNTFIIKRSDGSLLCRGWAETRKVFEALGLGVETDSVSLGGFISEKVDRVPRAGDVVRADGVEFRVLIASPRRAESIEVRRVAPSMMPPP
jgi:CBS domain containing-hemolysin-like protein